MDSFRPTQCGMGLREESQLEQLSAPATSLDVEIGRGTQQQTPSSRNHNHRYSQYPDPHCSAILERRHSSSSTLIESCSLTESSLASRSPLPWSPLGRHPHETR